MLSALLQLNFPLRDAVDSRMFLEGFLSKINKREFGIELSGFLGSCFLEDQALTNILDEAMNNLRAK